MIERKDEWDEKTESISVIDEGRKDNTFLGMKDAKFQNSCQELNIQTKKNNSQKVRIEVF